MLGLEEEDDIVAADLDMHSLILTSNPQDHGVRTRNIFVAFEGVSFNDVIQFCAVVT